MIKPAFLLSLPARRSLLTAVFALLMALLVASVHAQSAPQLDLNGPAAPGLDFAATFIENEGPTAIVTAELSIVDADSATLQGATLTLAPPVDAQIERLAVDTSGTPIRATYNASAGKLLLRNNATLADYAQVLRTAVYDNDSEDPDTRDRLVTFLLDDGAAQSPPAHTIVTIQAVNDAPVLDNSGDLRFSDINEDDTTQKGNAIATLLASGGGTPISDVDANDPQGIAVIEAGSSNGRWQYSLDAGATWLDFGAPADTAAVLLNSSARIRFLPQPNFSGQAVLTFRAWDQSSGQNGERGVDVSLNGGVTPFSVATETAIVTVLAVNDPPLVDANGRLPGRDTAATFLAGALPVPLTAADAAVVDLDSAAVISMTITLLNRPDGSAESIALPVVPTAITPGSYDPVTGQLVLTGTGSAADYSAALRALRYKNTAVPLNTAPRLFELRAGDGGGVSPVTQVTLQPILENTPPLLSEEAPLAFTPVAEDDSDPAGDSVADLLGPNPGTVIVDPDPGARFGFAVVAAQNENGRWQYSIDSGITWLDFGPLSPQSAVLLDEPARIRFLPAPDFAGAPRTITVRAWDQTNGASGYSKVDVTGDGSVGNSARSISVTVLPRNDAPQLTLSGGLTALYAEDGEPVVIAGPALSLTDADNLNLASATVRILDKAAVEPDVLSLPASTTSVRVRYDGDTGVLALNGEASTAVYQALLRAVTYSNTSQDPQTADRLIQFRAFDGVDSSNAVTAVVQVSASNDPPTLDLNGAAPGADNTVYLDADENSSGTPLTLAAALELEDVDDASLAGAVLELAPRPDGAAEWLAANPAGTNISAAYDPQDGRLTLNGVDSIANYRRVLRSVTYVNNKPYANRAVRTVTFRVADAAGSSPVHTVTIIPRPQFAFFPLLSQVPVPAPGDGEPNDACAQAYPISLNVSHSFAAEDRDDWYIVTLPGAAHVTVELRNFVPLQGQLLAGSGPCGALQRLGQNGDFAPTKIIDLGPLPAGNFYILVINDGPRDTGRPYELLVRAE